MKFNPPDIRPASPYHTHPEPHTLIAIIIIRTLPHAACFNVSDQSHKNPNHTPHTLLIIIPLHLPRHFLPIPPNSSLESLLPNPVPSLGPLFQRLNIFKNPPIEEFNVLMNIDSRHLTDQPRRRLRSFRFDEDDFLGPLGAHVWSRGGVCGLGVG